MRPVLSEDMPRTTGHGAMGSWTSGSCCSLQLLFPAGGGNFVGIGNRGLAVVMFPPPSAAQAHLQPCGGSQLPRRRSAALWAFMVTHES